MIALIWSIPSLNLMGIIATILSWIAYTSHKKGTDLASGVLYIAASFISLGVIIVSSTLLDLLGVEGPLRVFIVVDGILGIILFVIAGINALKGAAALKESGGHQNGFFE